jgi:F-type H+-transporting ATPase subunit epsilon
MPIQCDIVTQERTVYSEQVDYVSLPGSEGVMGILPNHAPLLTVLAFGEVKTRKDGDERFFAIGGGFAEVQPDKVTILADSAEQADEIDFERAQKARERAEQAMKEGVSEDAANYAQIEAALRRAQIRVDVSRRRRSSKPRRRLGVAELAGEAEDES